MDGWMRFIEVLKESVELIMKLWESVSITMNTCREMAKDNKMRAKKITRWFRPFEKEEINF